MIIDINAVNEDTKNQYKLLQKQVEELTEKYQSEDKERFSSITEIIEKTNGDWDKAITLIDGDKTIEIPILQIIAYEYCLATEKITEGRVDFETMRDRLFSKLCKFRIGNPIPGKDDACLYGKTHDDITAVPVTSKMYKLISPGAQHIGYFEGGKRKGAVFLLEEEKRKDLAVDDNGNNLEYKTHGVPFRNLPTFMTLLTYFRQTAFHEWNHENENDEIDNQNPSMEYEYESIDGKKYRNYQVISKYYTSENIGKFKEPKYVISEEKDEKGNPKRFYINANGDRRPLNEVRFHLELQDLGNNPILTSSGMTTLEIKPVIHNQVTEGFVEATARAMVYAIAPETQDLDEGRYFEKVEMAKKVIESRDALQGEQRKRNDICRFFNSFCCIKKRIRRKAHN